MSFFIAVAWLLIGLGIALEVKIKTKQKARNKYSLEENLMFCMFGCAFLDLNKFKSNNAHSTYIALNVL